MIHMPDLMPASVNGWITDSTETYDSENLYDYIDGGAELFLSYGFRSLLSRTYVRDNFPEIRADIFVMDSAPDAYGVFTHSREKEDNAFGQGSQIMEGAVIFWKSNHYVTLMSYPETPEVKSGLLHLAGYIDDQIREEGHLPEIVTTLPAEGLNRNSIVYFHHYTWQNSRFFLSNDDILRIGKNRDCAIAMYEENSPFYLLAVEYPDEKAVSEAITGLADAMKIREENLVTWHHANLNWCGYREKDNRLFLICKASSEKEAASFLKNRIAP